MTRIAIVAGSTRPQRNAALVAGWVLREARRLVEAGELAAEFEVVDLADVDLPMLDEPMPAIFGDHRHEHTRRWARTVDRFDGFVFVVPEYNKSFPAVLKNAVDYLFDEWKDKAAGFVGYGLRGGQRAVEQLRLVLSEVHVATVRTQAGLSIRTDLPDGTCAPAPEQHELLRIMLAEVVAWSGALQPLRATARA